VQLIEGRLFINGQVTERERVASIRTRDAFGREAEVPTYRETLPGGVSYQIIERDGDRGFYDNTSVYEVPEGHYFMMGDNRDNSTDSRVASVDQGVGYVPLENFVGRAELVFFSVEEGESVWQFWRWPVSLRWSRLFTPVR
jgi:signal peptidase I